MNLWTIYDHPTDYPDTFVARRFVVGGGEEHATNDVITGSLAGIRDSMEELGLYCIGREPGDHPNVVETWL